MPATRKIETLAAEIVRRAGASRQSVALAESCTGGMIAAALTDIAGSSAVFGAGFVTYSNEAKAGMLGVDPALIAKHGAVSGEVARAMALGALNASGADYAIAVTGIAGPDGGSADKPVGLVWFGVASRASLRAERRVFAGGSRAFVRAKSVETGLALLLAALESAP